MNNIASMRRATVRAKGFNKFKLKAVQSQIMEEEDCDSSSEMSEDESNAMSSNNNELNVQVRTAGPKLGGGHLQVATEGRALGASRNSSIGLF